jgi:Trp operon repressor
MTDPIIPRNNADRTGAAPIERLAEREIARRYRAALAEITARVNQMGLSPQSAQLLIDESGRILDRWLAEGTPRQFWYSDDFTSVASAKGAGLANVNLARLSSEYAAARPLEAIIYSDAYITRLSMVRLADLEHFTGLSAAARSDLAGIITNAVADGLSVRNTQRQIADRMGVSMSRAKLYAQTQLPEALREATWAETEWADEELEIKTGLLWTSTLLPTTRQTHAARHGKAYSVAEVREFYSKDANRFRCHCAQTTVLLDENGKPILTPKLRISMTAERQKWQA